MLVCTTCLGAIPPAVDFDLQGCIDQQLKAGATKVVVPPGRYRVTPKHAVHLALHGLKDVEIGCDGVEMVCTETTQAISISDCTRLTLHGLSIDYDPLPFTQGHITQLSPDKKTVDVELFEGYPPASAARNFKYEIFRPDTRTLRCEDRYISKLEAVDERHLRLTAPGGKAANAEQVGDLIVIGAEYTPHGNAGHAIVCERNTEVELRDINLYASNCFGFLEGECDASRYVRCHIDRRAPENDPVKRADARLRTLNADANHSSNALRGPSYIECSASFMGDDAINIHGSYHLVTDCQPAGDNTALRVLCNNRFLAAVGEPVELWAYEGLRLPDATVVAVEPDSPETDDEIVWLGKQNIYPYFRHNWHPKIIKLTVAGHVTLSRGSVVAAARHMGNGFLVQGCRFGFMRSRGILIKASDGKVIGNTLTSCMMASVLVAPEWWWLESGSSCNVEVRDNHIINCHGIPISVEAVAGTGKIAPAGAHRHLTISGNTIEGSPAPLIRVQSTDGLSLTGNVLRPTNDGEVIVLRNCAAVTQDGNRVEGQ